MQETISTMAVSVQTVRSNLPFGNVLLGLRFGSGVGWDFRCLRAADLSQYVGQHVRFCRVQAVFVAGFGAGEQVFRPALLCLGLLPD